MFRMTGAVWLGLAAALLASPAAYATEAPHEIPELQVEEVDASQHPAVRLVVSVPRTLVGTDLTGGFAVWENGSARQVTATAVPTDGLQVVLAVDTSASMEGEPIEAAQRAAQGFLDQMPGGVEVAVVTFSSEPRIASPLDTDLGAAAAAIAGLRTGGETALYDGLAAATSVFTSTGGRRAIVVLSDGGDTVSETTLEAALIELVSSAAGFHAIELQSPEADSAALERLAVAAGGVVVPADEPAVLDTAFEEIAGQIVNRYELRFDSEGGGPTVLLVAAQTDEVVAAVRKEVRFPDPPQLPSPTQSTGSAEDTPAAITPSPGSVAPGRLVVLDWWQRPNALWIGAAAMFVALSATGLAMRRRQGMSSAELDTYLLEDRPPLDQKASVGGLAERAMLIAERAVGHSRSDLPLGRRLENAGVHLRVGEFVVVWVAVTLATAAVAAAFAGLLPGIGAGGVAAFAVSSWLRRRAQNRQAAFAEQLPDLLQLMAGSVRAGFGLMQAIDVVAREVPSPAGEEFRRVRIETQLGRDTNDALFAMADRVGSEDFKWIVEAVEIHRDVGGDFADILDSVTDTVRTRNRIRRKVQALSAEGRLTGLILTLLPFGLALVILIVNPAYLTELVTTTPGRILIVAGLGLMAVGGVWMRRITTAEY